MKQLQNIFPAAAAIIAALVISCNKVEQENESIPVYKMTVNAIKTKALADDGSAISSTWTAGDKVEVWTSDGVTTKYGTITAESSGSSTKLSGTLDSTPSYAETLLLKYLSADYDSQDGTLTGNATSIDKVCDYATATVTATVSGGSVTTSDATFASQQAILKLTIKNISGSDITSSIIGLTVIDGVNVYTVTPSSLSTIYVAVSAITSTQTITFTASDGTSNYRKAVTGKTISAGNLYPITLTSLYAGSLTGVFSIAEGTTVRFSEGNLQAKTADGGSNWTWAFASNQYGYIGASAANTSINGSGTVSTNGTVDLFGWNGVSATDNNYGINNSTSDSDYGATSGESLKNDWGHNAITNGGNAADAWRSMSHAEWYYLLNTRAASTVGRTANTRYAMVQIKSCANGLAIFPDSYTHPVGVAIPTCINAVTAYNKYTLAEWNLMEAAGAVFIPCAGYRENVTVNKPGEYIRLWTNISANETLSKSLYLKPGTTLDHSSNLNRHYGASVRLVKIIE